MAQSIRCRPVLAVAPGVAETSAAVFIGTEKLPTWRMRPAGTVA